MKRKLSADHTEQLSQAVAGIVTSYRDLGNINHVDGPNIPSGASVARVLHELKSLLFPGFHAEEHLEAASLVYHVGQKCAAVIQKLAPEICRALEHTCRNDESCMRSGQCKSAGYRIAMSLLRSLPELRRLLDQDVDAAFAGDPAARSPEEVITCYPGLQAIMVHRIAHYLHQEGVPLIPRIMSEYVHSQTGIDIHPGAKIGERFFIDHGTGVVIGETSEIGRNVKIYQGVTLGALSVSKGVAGRKRHPTLEDEVTVYAGATVLGGDTVIGCGSVIGGNVWLTRSIPPYSRVIARSDVVDITTRENQPV